MKLFAALFLAAAAITANAECDDEEQVCIPTGESCMNKDKECCGEDECYGYHFFKKCQPVPKCIPQWQDCNNGLECCDESFKCLEDNGKMICKEEVITPRTAPIPPPTNTNTTKIPGEPVTFNYACSTGDPHLTTFDGLRYDCQGHGEFVLFKSTVTQRQIQMRYTQMTSRTWSVGEGIVIQDEGNTPKVQITMPAITAAEGGGVTQLLGPRDKNCQVQFFVNDVQRDLFGGTDDIEGLEVTVQHGKTVMIKYTESGMSVMVSHGFWNQCFLQVCAEIPDTDPGMGLWGVPDGDISNDWTRPDGTVKELKNTNSRIRNEHSYNYCTKQWCIRDVADSLFYYNQAPTKTFEDFEMCDLPYDTFIIDDLEDQLTPEIQEFCGNDLDCVIDAVTGGGIEAAADAKILRAGFLSQSCNKEGGECVDSDCCDGFTCVTLGGLTTPTCHADPEEPTCYPETATCSADRPCCDGFVCEEHANGEFYCKEIPPPCSKDRTVCVADSDCCGDTMCVGPEGQKRCMDMVKENDIFVLPEMEHCGYEGAYQCHSGASCVRSAQGTRCTTLPTCWTEPFRPCGDNLGMPDCCEDSGNACQMKDGFKQCVPQAQCSEHLFPCTGEFSTLKVPCCEGLTCQWRGGMQLCVNPPEASCTRTAAPAAAAPPAPPACTNDQFKGECTSTSQCKNMYPGSDDCKNSHGGVCYTGSEVSACLVAPEDDDDEEEVVLAHTEGSCTEAEPICFNDDGSRPSVGGGGMICGVCVNDKVFNGVDTGCSADLPRCLAGDDDEPAMDHQGSQCGEAGNNACKNVNNEMPRSGCTAEKPLCIKGGNWNAEKGQLGESCAICYNNKDGDRKDSGCSAEFPRCVKADGSEVRKWQGGGKCVAPLPALCRHTDGDQDDTCSADKSICAKQNGRRPELQGTGEFCAKCVNNREGVNDHDDGCTSTNPVCVDENDEAPELGHVGVKCAPPNVTAKCKNTNQSNGYDHGCDENQPNKFCTYADGKNAGRNKYGDKCALCINNHSTYNNIRRRRTDAGCSGQKRRCVLDNDKPPSHMSAGTKCI